MRKPDGWHGFSVNCDFWDVGLSNMSPRSQQLYCNRKDRQGKNRPYWVGDVHYGRLKCHWNVCPKLKEQRQQALKV